MTSLALLTTDTVRSLFTLFKDGERYTDYHVRAIYSDKDPHFDDTNVNMDSVRMWSATIDPDIDAEMGSAYGMDHVGFAVYGHQPEPYFICGDELPYRVAKAIANVLNMIYNDPSVEHY